MFQNVPKYRKYFTVSYYFIIVHILDDPIQFNHSFQIVRITSVDSRERQHRNERRNATDEFRCRIEVHRRMASTCRIELSRRIEWSRRLY